MLALFLVDLFSFGYSFLFPCFSSTLRTMAAPKAVKGEQKGGKSMAEKKPVKMMTTEKRPVAKDGGNKKKKAKKSSESYKIYIYKVLKQVGLGAAGF